MKTDDKRESQNGFHQIREAMKKTCEKNHAECPNLQVARRSRKRLPLTDNGNESGSRTRRSDHTEGQQRHVAPRTVEAQFTRATTSRRALVDGFIEKVWSATGRKITRTDIWRAVGHKKPRQFQYWQAGQDCAPGETHGATKADAENFRRILSMPPEKFAALLEKKDLVSAIS